MQALFRWYYSDVTFSSFAKFFWGVAGTDQRFETALLSGVDLGASPQPRHLSFEFADFQHECSQVCAACSEMRCAHAPRGANCY